MSTSDGTPNSPKDNAAPSQGSAASGGSPGNSIVGREPAAISMADRSRDVTVTFANPVVDIDGSTPVTFNGALSNKVKGIVVEAGGATGRIVTVALRLNFDKNDQPGALTFSIGSYASGQQHSINFTRP